MTQLNPIRQGSPVPDPCAFVMCCPWCHWQLQIGPRAKSDLGGSVAAMQAVAWVAEQHRRAEHGDTELPPIFGGLTLTDGRPPTGGVVGVGLPRWWVDRG